MKKYFSREFLLSFSLIVAATIMVFSMDKVGFVEWSLACGGFVAIYTGGKTVQKIKAPG